MEKAPFHRSVATALKELLVIMIAERSFENCLENPLYEANAERETLSFNSDRRFDVEFAGRPTSHSFPSNIRPETHTFNKDRYLNSNGLYN